MPAEIPSTLVQLRWADTDGYGHVNNVAWLRYLEEARIRIFGLPDRPETAAADSLPAFHVLGTDCFTVTAGHRVEYVHELTYHGQSIVVEVWISRIGASSLDMSFRVLDQDRRTVYLLAETTQVVRDVVTRTPHLFTEAEFESLTRHMAAPNSFRTKHRWAAGRVARRHVSAADVREQLDGARRVVVLDDDPTGTQTVRDVPVLTRWSDDDVRWAMRQPAAGFFVLTNTRSLTPGEAAARNTEVAQRCLAVAAEMNVEVAFASRGDSTLRGHFPLEPETLAEALSRNGQPIDAMLLCPAYIDAGRVTLDGIHWLQSVSGLTPVAESEFARDSTFGYRSSRLADWVEEKSGGRIPASTVSHISIDRIREGVGAVAPALRAARGGQVVVIDAVSDDDLKVISLAVLDAESAGSRFIYRVGPSFVRARLGQEASAPLDDAALSELVNHDSKGLVVVGSHVELTTRQLAVLRQRVAVEHIELDVMALLDDQRADVQIKNAVADAAAALHESTVVLSTSRHLVTGSDPATSLVIARRISNALTKAVSELVGMRKPAYIVAKGGITSSDIATEALKVERAWVRGSLLPGVVSLWQPADGPSAGLPFVVFAGNVGTESALAEVVQRLETC